ncbi:MAG: hypothetical protein Kow0080_05020 [Candidatus Promineifilaceae bacterium]
MQKNVSTPNQSLTLIILFAFSLFWTCFSSIFLVTGITQDILGMAIVGGLFVLIGLSLFLYALLLFYTRRRVGKPDILVSNTTLKIGETFDYSLAHQFKNNIQVDKISVKLVFRETATYQQGTDTRTVVHDHVIQHFEEPGRHFKAREFLQLNYKMQIPYNAMHSLEVRRNKLEWLVIFELDIPRLPNFTEHTKLTVLPEYVGGNQ